MEAITREEKIMSGENLTPITRKEMFLAKAAGQNIETPEPITREEMFLSMIQGGSGGGSEDDPETDGNDAVKYIESNFANVSLPTAKSIKAYAFFNDETIVDIYMPKVTSIGSNAFSGCSKLELTSLPNGLTSIGRQAFNKCSKITLTSLPSGLTDIDDSTFYSCPRIALKKLPSGINRIGINAFFYCSGLTTLTFEGTPQTIASSAFSNCNNLKTINVPWADGAVLNAPWGAAKATINYSYTGE